jgi:hypothetical protein
VTQPSRKYGPTSPSYVTPPHTMIPYDAAIYRQQKVLSHFPVWCWIDWLLMIKNWLIESGPSCRMMQKQARLVGSTDTCRCVWFVYLAPFRHGTFSLSSFGCICRYPGSDTEISTSLQSGAIRTRVISAFRRIITETMKTGRCKSSGLRKETRVSTNARSARSQYAATSLTSILSVSLHIN